jgi:carboxypeptidase PM20D1
MTTANSSRPGIPPSCARHCADLSEHIFRFLPLRLDSDDLKRMHGIDERVGIRDYETAIRMYRQLLVNAART